MLGPNELRVRAAQRLVEDHALEFRAGFARGDDLFHDFEAGVIGNIESDDIDVPCHLADAFEEFRLAELAFAAEFRQRSGAAALEQAGDFESAYLLNGNRMETGYEARPDEPEFHFSPLKPVVDGG